MTVKIEFLKNSQKAEFEDLIKQLKELGGKLESKSDHLWNNTFEDVSRLDCVLYF